MFAVSLFRRQPFTEEERERLDFAFRSPPVCHSPRRRTYQVIGRKHALEGQMHRLARELHACYLLEPNLHQPYCPLIQELYRCPPPTDPSAPAGASSRSPWPDPATDASARPTAVDVAGISSALIAAQLAGAAHAHSANDVPQPSSAGGHSTSLADCGGSNQATPSPTCDESSVPIAAAKDPAETPNRPTPSPKS